MRRDTLIFGRWTHHPYLILVIRNWNKDLNVKDKTVKAVEENKNFLWSENGEGLFNKIQNPKVHLKRLMYLNV